MRLCYTQQARDRQSELGTVACAVAHTIAALVHAVDAVAIQFVGPSGCQARLDKCAMSLFKEDGDLALRPHVLWDEMYMPPAAEAPSAPAEAPSVPPSEAPSVPLDERSVVRTGT